MVFLGQILQVELRDVNTGSKVNERLRTDETVESMYAFHSLVVTWCLDRMGKLGRAI